MPAEFSAGASIVNRGIAKSPRRPPDPAGIPSRIQGSSVI
nr:MAG TPA: hypothetical protein [Caudoviricetes sp.]